MAEPGEPESLYEIGGTVIHPKNQLMKQLVQAAGLREKPPAKVASDTRFTIYGRPGQDPLFQTYFGNSYLQQLEVIWRYGLRSLMEMNSLVGNLVKNFNRYLRHEILQEKIMEVRCAKGETFLSLEHRQTLLCFLDLGLAQLGHVRFIQIIW